MKKEVKTLKDFYSVISGLRKTKSELVKEYLQNKVSEKKIKKLKKIYSLLKNTPKSSKKDKYVLEHRGEKILVCLKYELDELEKDIIFLEKGEDKLINYFKKSNKYFEKENKKIISKFKKTKFNFFITDRDGTINNYCGRYLSSVQSVYNSIFLLRFLNKKIKQGIIMSSGPLKELLKLDITPKNNFIYTGSKGREIYFKRKKIKQKIPNKHKKKLKKVSNKIGKLLSEKKYNKFKYIGSGFQNKLGEITIARQTDFKTINKKNSFDFLMRIKNIVSEVDKDNKYLYINDTGKDIEIGLKSKGCCFNKGQGIKFIEEKLSLDFSKGNILLAGDTESDISFIKEIQNKNRNAKYIFVTRNDSLKRKIKNKLKRGIFLSNPDTFIFSLNNLAK